MRKKNAAKNVIITVITNIICFVFGYGSRMMLARYLSSEYLGINSLFQDILSILSISELGIASAMAYALYKPVAENDEEHIAKLINLYKRMYMAVAAFIAIAGLILVPFLPVLIKEYNTIPHIAWYYLMFLAQTVLSYCCYYKTAVLTAYQRQHVMSVYFCIGTLARYTLQIIILWLTHNFALYVGIQALFSFLPNLIGSRRAEKDYPFICGDKKTLPEKEERHTIYKNIFAMAMHKIGTVLVNNTDSLIMSSFLGLSIVGIFSNYRLIVNTLSKFVKQAIESISATVGNLGAVETYTKIHSVYKKVYALCAVGYSYCCVMMAVLFTDYILLGFGNEYLLPTGVCILMLVDFYTKGMRTPTLCFRDAMGVFWYDRYKPIFEIVINLVTSIILVQKIGISGIIAGTLISFFLTSFWVDPYVWFKYGTKENWEKNLTEYFIEYILDGAKTVFIAWAVYKICAVIPYAGFLGIITKGITGTLLFIPFAIVLYIFPYIHSAKKSGEWDFSFVKVRRKIS